MSDAKYTPAQRFRLAAERIEIERKKIADMATTVRMKSESSEEICDELLAIVSDCFAVPASLITGAGRQREYAWARHAYCYLCNKLNPFCTLKQIGASINRDHSTVLNSMKKCDQLRLTDFHFTQAFNACLQKVQESNKQFMQRLQYDETEEQNRYGTTEGELQRALKALALLRDFMGVWNAHDLADETHHIYPTLEELKKIRKQAIEQGF